MDRNPFRAPSALSASLVAAMLAFSPVSAIAQKNRRPCEHGSPSPSPAAEELATRADIIAVGAALIRRRGSVMGEVPARLKESCKTLNYRVAFFYRAFHNGVGRERGFYYMERNPETGDLVFELSGLPKSPRLYGGLESQSSDNFGNLVDVRSSTWGGARHYDGPIPNASTPITPEVARCVQLAARLSGDHIINRL